jgi:hypothetical protein
VVETLTTRVEDLNFVFDGVRVYPSGYHTDVAGLFRSNRIRVTSDYGRVSTDPPAQAGQGHYKSLTLRGETHFLFIHPSLTEARASELYVKKLSPFEAADLRGTIIHECTHALQDYQRGPITPRTAEACAYLAGAIARRKWGYSQRVTNSRVSGFAYALTMADRFLAERDRHRRYVIPQNEVQDLKSLVTLGSAQHYVYNGV